MPLLVGSLLTQIPVHFKIYMRTYGIFCFVKRFLNDLHLGTWARRHQNVLRAGLKYKAKVEVSRPFVLLCLVQKTYQ